MSSYSLSPPNSPATSTTAIINFTTDDYDDTVFRMDVDDNDNDNDSYYYRYRDAPPPMYSSHTSTPHSRSSFDSYYYPSSILRAPRMGFVPLPDDDEYESELPPPPYVYENEYEEPQSRRFPSYCTYTPPSPVTSLPLPPSPSSSTATVSLITSPSSHPRTRPAANTYTPPHTQISVHQRSREGLRITTAPLKPTTSTPKKPKSKPAPTKTNRITSPPLSSVSSASSSNLSGEYGYSFCWHPVCPPKADELTPPPSPPRGDNKNKNLKRNTLSGSSRSSPSSLPHVPTPFAPCRHYVPLPS